MALVTCKDCGREVSSRAEACPQCGAPIAGNRETAAAGTSIKTIQGTSKKFKLQSVLSVALIIFGGMWLTISAKTPGATPSGTAMLLVVIGLFWYAINRVRIWWHHK